MLNAVEAVWTPNAGGLREVAEAQQGILAFDVVWNDWVGSAGDEASRSSELRLRACIRDLTR